VTKHVSIESELQSAFNNATAEVNQWRGRCINLFANGERIVGDALAKRNPVGTKLPMLVSQKVKQLASDLTGSDPALLEHLNDFGALLVTRSALTHGVATVWLDRSKSWRVVLQWVSIRASVRKHEEQAFTRSEAESFRRALQSVVQRLEQALSKLQA
jgi:hypothetical protein